jgi:hypothetical protein
MHLPERLACARRDEKAPGASGGNVQDPQRALLLVVAVSAVGVLLGICLLR